LKNLIKITFTLIFTTILLLGFAVPVNMVGNWYQQFMPNIGGRQITDITFQDSLIGYSVAWQSSDTSYILKTTNGGNDWQIIYRNFYQMKQLQFLNINTGYACGAFLYKTSNGGINWVQVNAPAISPQELYVLNEDTIWLVQNDFFIGGVFRTTNGGSNWVQQLNVNGNNPDHIYMYNRNIGFVSQASVGGRLYKTTNSGVNWTLLAGDYFTDMYFADSLTGWKCSGLMKKTTDGGLSWLIQELPTGPNIFISVVRKFSNLNRDTIWAVGGVINFGGSTSKGMIFRTTNGGDNWLYQVPDTSINIFQYSFIKFINKDHGWAYSVSKGVHTTTGGDPVWITGIEQISTEVPQEFNLYQNYPNPFNPSTKIKFQIPLSRGVTGEAGRGVLTLLMIYNTLGQEVTTLVNQQLSPGTYSVEWNASNYPSGIYFCRLTSGDFSAVNKMILLK